MKKLSLILFVTMLAWGQAIQAEQAGMNVSLEQMEQHWQQVISETDPAKRQELLAEHRKLMEQMQTMHGKGMMGDNHMMHGMEMHRMMMDMISD